MQHPLHLFTDGRGFGGGQLGRLRWRRNPFHRPADPDAARRGCRGQLPREDLGGGQGRIRESRAARPGFIHPGRIDGEGINGCRLTRRDVALRPGGIQRGTAEEGVVEVHTVRAAPLGEGRRGVCRKGPEPGTADDVVVVVSRVPCRQQHVTPAPQEHGVAGHQNGGPEPGVGRQPGHHRRGSEHLDIRRRGERFGLPAAPENGAGPRIEDDAVERAVAGHVQFGLQQGREDPGSGSRRISREGGHCGGFGEGLRLQLQLRNCGLGNRRRLAERVLERWKVGSHQRHREQRQHHGQDSGKKQACGARHAVLPSGWVDDNSKGRLVSHEYRDAPPDRYVGAEIKQ